MHIHLDPVGGIAGDMFVAALLHAWPEHESALAAAIARLGAPAGVGARSQDFNDGILAGMRYLVDDHAGAHGHDAHPHRRFRDIAALIRDSGLAQPVIARALAIFTLLAEAEGRVHGVAAQDVTFHEIGAWDSIIDITAAACLIDRIGAASWSVAPLPIGSGRVHTAHGEMPVPPPAVALLLEGFAVFDDGRPGERVTPTGAAILRHLAPSGALPAGAHRQGRVGYGFGTRRFAGISNMLRVLAFEPVAATTTADEVAVLRFEVDDQTPEDLAAGLERLRAEPGVLDVVQSPVFGKKGRMAIQIQLLATIDAAERAASRCLAETTTLGVRLERVQRRILARESLALADAQGAEVRIKSARRPDGTRTVKAEMDDIAAGAGDHAARARRRRQLEAAARRQAGDNDG